MLKNGELRRRNGLARCRGAAAPIRAPALNAVGVQRENSHSFAAIRCFRNWSGFGDVIRVGVFPEVDLPPVHEAALFLSAKQKATQGGQVSELECNLRAEI